MTLEDAIQLVEDGWPQRFTVSQASVYLEALSDLDPNDLKRAVVRLIRSEEFRPSVARIRREVEAQSLPTVEQALAQAESVIRYRDAKQYVNGSGFSPIAPDVDERVTAVMQAVPKSFGWQERFINLWKQQAWRNSE